MLYRFLRLVVPYVLRSHFHRVFIDGLENVPKHGPVIIASSHPNSFLDACLLAVLLKRPLHFLVRADVFKYKPVAWLLRAMHQLPVYRSDSGREGLTDGNARTFGQCFELLKRNGTILIFSEGTTVQDKQLRPLRKGTARLAFGALDHLPPDTELHVLPVAVNYTHHNDPAAEVLIGIGKPVPVRSWLGSKDKNSPTTLRTFSEELLDRMKAQHISVENAPTSETVEDAFTLLRSLPQHNRNLVYGNTSHGRLMAEKKLAVHIEELARTDSDAYNRLSSDLKEYIEQAHTRDLALHSPAKPNTPKPHKLFPGCMLVAFMISMLFFVPRHGGYIIGKRSASGTIFRDSVAAGSSLILYLLYFPLLLGISYWLIGYWAVPVVVLLAIAGAYDTRLLLASLNNGHHRLWQRLHKLEQEEYHSLNIQHYKLCTRLGLPAENVQQKN